MKKLLIILLAAISAATLSAQKAGNNMRISPAQKLGFVEQIIEQYYVDTVNANHVVDEAIVAMLRTLDPHST